MRRYPELVLESKHRLLGVLDPGGSLGQTDPHELRVQLVEPAAARRLLSELTQSGDRRGGANDAATANRFAGAVEREPGAVAVGRMESTEVDALAGTGLGREHRGDLGASFAMGRCAGCDPLQLVGKAHDDQNRPVSERHDHARALFAPLGPTYERTGALLSLGQDPRWRRFLVSRVPARPGETVLDVATGTGAVARELVRVHGCSVVGLDQSPEMLAEARRQDGGIEYVEATAERLPFPDSSFDHLTFTYLLRYVDAPGATLQELARVVAPGGTVAMLEFGLPRGPWRPLWELYVRLGLPFAGMLICPRWYEVGRFLGGSIRDFHARFPESALLGLWHDAGIEGVQARRLSLGGGLVVWGRRS